MRENAIVSALMWRRLSQLHSNKIELENAWKEVATTMGKTAVKVKTDWKCVRDKSPSHKSPSMSAVTLLSPAVWALDCISRTSPDACVAVLTMKESATLASFARHARIDYVRVLRVDVLHETEQDSRPTRHNWHRSCAVSFGLFNCFLGIQFPDFWDGYLTCLM